jgi:hypothetical protein
VIWSAHARTEELTLDMDMPKDESPADGEPERAHLDLRVEHATGYAERSGAVAMIDGR